MPVICELYKYDESRLPLRRLCRQWAATQMVHMFSGEMANLDLPTPPGENARLCDIMDDVWAHICSLDEEARHEHTTFGRRTYCERVISEV